REWDLWTTGSNDIVSYVAVQPLKSGSMDVKYFTDHLISTGGMRSGSRLGQIGYGVEIVDTGGAERRFGVLDLQLDGFLCAPGSRETGVVAARRAVDRPRARHARGEVCHPAVRAAQGAGSRMGCTVRRNRRWLIVLASVVTRSMVAPATRSTSRACGISTVTPLEGANRAPPNFRV